MTTPCQPGMVITTEERMIIELICWDDPNGLVPRTGLEVTTIWELEALPPDDPDFCWWWDLKSEEGVPEVILKVIRTHYSAKQNQYCLILCPDPELYKTIDDRKAQILLLIEHGGGWKLSENIGPR